MNVNGVFEGGGVRGISLVGAIKAAELNGITFQNVAGTSSGAIVAALLAAGYTAEDMKQLILAMPFHSFMQRSPIFSTKWIGPAARLLLKKGLYAGERLEHWIHKLLAAKGIRTFGDLKKNQLRIIASDITNGRLLVLPDDIKQYGIEPQHFTVSKAVRMSTSIPYFFDPVIIRYSVKTPQGRSKSFQRQLAYIVDGGLLSNFPLWLFDEIRDPATRRLVPTIGFQLVGQKEGQPHRIYGLFSMLQAMFETMMSAHDERYIGQHNRFRTIKIPTLGTSMTDFDITSAQSMALYASGLEAGEHFFSEWDYGYYEKLHAQFCNKKCK
ncbi:patatin-like phospholipase family protein [Paenibacillus sp. 481]|uniref:patatin-like phospholipase family protein n=1 Tax=Paenibacillus sp. 481 TaxID=2835869 RepID=UPI001E5D5365|nr:patatin-like phospholipase family protein [Paenibacillus sp. 481]UHA72857.1 patatin-like phospholipase family protein [Paenibacillus sp. 481]